MFPHTQPLSDPGDDDDDIENDESSDFGKDLHFAACSHNDKTAIAIAGAIACVRLPNPLYEVGEAAFESNARENAVQSI